MGKQLNVTLYPSSFDNPMSNMDTVGGSNSLIFEPWPVSELELVCSSCSLLYLIWITNEVLPQNQKDLKASDQIYTIQKLGQRVQYFHI